MTGMTWELLDRYLAHQCADSEIELVKRWLEEESANPGIAKALSEAIASRHPSSHGVWISLHRLVSLTIRPFVPLRGTRRRVMEVIAFGVLAAGAAVAARERFLRLRHDESTVAPMRVATTPAGQRASLHLSDGTRVTLGVASTLRSPAVFGATMRQVELAGEALFEVAADQQRPFVVRAADIVARDLGTSFLVRAYPEEAHARIVVREGKVAMRGVSNPDTARMSLIAPGQLGRLSDNGIPIVERADTAAYFSWTQGRLTLDNIPLRDALPQLSRWWDVDFRLADTTLGDVPLTATLGPRLSPDMLDLLASALGMRQEREGRTVTFYPATGIH
jgi:ferric-dicitrate binding protein FerR (iron transport regulator)